VADPRSGCRVPRGATVSHADALLRVGAVADRLRPEVVLRLGSPPASKVLGQWLEAAGAWQLAVTAHGARFDAGSSLAGVLSAEPGAFCHRLLAELHRGEGAAAPEAPEGWYEAWTAADAEAASALREVLAAHPEPTEPAVARDVTAAVPAGGHLVVSSSMPVRDVEWYAAPRAGLTVHANRGANGIDGVVSTGIGVALGSGEPTAVLVGDVAFLHDASALTAARHRPVDLAVVVVDNDGGGIFSFLPQAGAMVPGEFEQLFGTPHGTDVAALAAAHGCEVRRIEKQAEVGPATAGALALGGVHVVVVPTERAANVAVHDELHAAVAAALSR
jgi:2-succinyl-5-enolpyruvyl-6-hydroxy-3-cyclohexene-1-carboxylate synthase